MSSPINVVTVAEIRPALPRYRRRVSLYGQRFAISHYGRIVGVLMPLRDADLLGIKASEEIAITEMRSHLTECWEQLAAGLDCYYVLYHQRRVAAFVSPRCVPDLPMYSIVD